MAYLDWPDNAHISADDPLTYWPAMTRRLDPDQLHRQIYWHALPVGWEQLEYTTFLERRRTLLAQVVRDGFSTLWDDSAPEPAEGVIELLRVGESQTVEFKSTARWNLHARKPDKKMEHVITKTVCGFLNAQGGKLLIGVDDDGNVVGLDSDLQTLRKGNKDGYELFLRSCSTTASPCPPPESSASASRASRAGTSASSRHRRLASRPSPSPTKAGEATRSSGSEPAMPPNNSTATTCWSTEPTTGVSRLAGAPSQSQPRSTRLDRRRLRSSRRWQ